MKENVPLVFFILFAISFLQTDALDYCYKAQFRTNASTTGDVSSRGAEIQQAVVNILDELKNDLSVGFDFTSNNATLVGMDDLGINGTLYEVDVCLTGTDFDKENFTKLLETSNFLTPIDGEVPKAGDYNECENSNYFSQCDVNSNCVNRPGDFFCRCHENYIEMLREETAEQICELPTKHNCSSDSVFLEANLFYFDTKLQIDYRDLLLGNCSGFISGDSIVFSGQCNPVIEDENSTYVYYRWNLTNVNNSVAAINVGNYVTIPITCVFDSSSTISLNVSAERKDIDFDDDVISGEAYDFRVNAFENPEATRSIPQTVDTDTKVYFELGTANRLPQNTKIQCESLSTSAADGSSIRLDLMRGGCPVDATNQNSRILRTLNIVQNGIGPRAIVGVDSHFYGRSRITIATFVLNVCVDTGGSNCEYSCSSRSRRRRSTITQRIRRDTVQSEEVKFAFERSPDDGCSRYCGEGGICVFDQARNQECVCADGYVRQNSGICTAEIEDPAPDILDIAITPIIALLAFLTLSCSIVGVLFVVRRLQVRKGYDVTFEK